MNVLNTSITVNIKIINMAILCYVYFTTIMYLKKVGEPLEVLCLKFKGCGSGTHQEHCYLGRTWKC